jgi:NTP pyrophosphatase (non-canonical NTP hydrolase)
MDLHELQKMLWENTKTKGWHTAQLVDVPMGRLLSPDARRRVNEQVALIMTELAEIIEWTRTSDQVGHFYEGKYPNPNDSSAALNQLPKPVGIPSEIADVLIRTLNLASDLGIDALTAVEEKAAYNTTRPQRHGGKSC